LLQLKTFFDYPLKEEDLYGPLQAWLKTQEKPFDPTKIRTDVPLVMYHQDGQNINITYSSDNAPNFIGANKGKEPFRRYIVGFIEYKGPDNSDYIGVVIPTEYFDINNPDKNQFIMTIASFSGEYWTRENILIWMGYWQNKMNVTTITPNMINVTTGQIDPLIAKTFAKYPDMDERFLKFVNNNSFKPGGDMTALSEDDMILGSEIFHITSGPQWYQ
jgi:hypothetical protein